MIGAALTDPAILGRWFEGPSWSAWRACCRAAFGEEMTKAERELFRGVANRAPPKRRVRELWIVAGRRSGKDSIASAIVTHMAASFDPAGKLRPGERATCVLLAVDRSQAATCLGYIRAYFELVPALKALVVGETVDGFELSNCVDVAVMANDFRSIRGRTILCCVLDECAFWQSDASSRPDVETLRALRPGMLTLASQALLVAISSAYRRTGVLYDTWAKHFGGASDKVLVIHAPSRALNPLLAEDEIDAALDEDREAALADFMSEWRDDLASYISRASIEAAVDRGVTVRPYDPAHRSTYTSWIDASSGASDSFAAAVAHKEGHHVVLDALLEVRAPFNTADATWQVVEFLKGYGLRSTMGDDYARGWVKAEMLRYQFTFDGKPAGADRSKLYSETAPLFSSGRARLLDDKRLVTQYASLERRLLPGGHERVDHPARGHDDLSNVVAGCFWRATSAKPVIDWVKAYADCQTWPRFIGSPHYGERPLGVGELEAARARLAGRRYGC